MDQPVSQALSIEDRLLNTAIDQFGRDGLEGASTRRIASAAGTTMSAITYHYGGKEGLYLAAARHIVEQIKCRVAPTVQASIETFRTNSTSDTAIEAVLTILDRFAQVLVNEESAPWARFIVREQMRPTEAFDILYEKLMGEMLGHLSSLIHHIGGGRYAPAEARLKAMALMGQAFMFRFARAALYRAMDWSEVTAEGAAAIRQTIRAHSIAILNDISEGRKS